MATFRITTYNIHKCRGLDRRVRPRRIVEVLKETESDIIALQEVVGWMRATLSEIKYAPSPNHLGLIMESVRTAG
jgi:endonuclease/exonuclease/phosphatase family metal-dependent hydrolase